MAVSPRAPKPTSTGGFLLGPVWPSGVDGTRMGFNPSAVGQFPGHCDRLGGCWAKSSTRRLVVSGTDRALVPPIARVTVLCTAHPQRSALRSKCRKSAVIFN